MPIEDFDLARAPMCDISDGEGPTLFVLSAESPARARIRTSPQAERSVAQAVLDGLSNAEIAHGRLGLFARSGAVQR